jgi:hypothetical protein
MGGTEGQARPTMVPGVSCRLEHSLVLRGSDRIRRWVRSRIAHLTHDQEDSARVRLTQAHDAVLRG